jgi:glutamate/tyrosine decarboxylase-like PLP-dependent enzyme
MVKNLSSDKKFIRDAFIFPDRSNLEIIKATVHKFIDEMLEELAQTNLGPPIPETPYNPPEVFPKKPIGSEQALAALKTIFRSSVRPNHEGWVPHMNGPSNIYSAIGDFGISVLDNNMLSHEMAPALGVLENQLAIDIARRFGLPEGAGGLLVGGGSVANLQALAVARNKAFPDIFKRGLGNASSPVLLASELAHTSLEKCAMLLGLGTDAVIRVKTQGGRMTAEEAKISLENAKKNGLNPFCIVATAGTTSAGTIDHLGEIASLSKQEGLWFHVDAAHGGGLAFSDSYKKRLRGIEKADSIIFNPHKWFYVARNCAFALFADPTLLATHFKVPLPYVKEGKQTPNLGEISIHGTNRADCLKLFLTCQMLGQEGIEYIINKNMSDLEYLVEELEKIPGLEFATPCDVNITCFRIANPKLAPRDQDELNRSLQRDLLEKDEISVSGATLDGKFWLRSVWLNPIAGKRVAERICARLRDAALKK